MHIVDEAKTLHTHKTRSNSDCQSGKMISRFQRIKVENTRVTVIAIDNQVPTPPLLSNVQSSQEFAINHKF